MDERKIAELFRDAASDAPPASFGVDNVVSASARETVRRRNRLALGSAMAAVLVFGGVVAYANLMSVENGLPTSAGSALEAESPNLTPFGVPEPRDGGTLAEPDLTGGLPPKSIPENTSTQGDVEPGKAGRPTTGGTSGCQEVDRELAVALADELPAADGLQPSHAVANCPPGARGASFLVRDGRGVYGVVSVVLLPVGQQALASTSIAEAHHDSAKGVVYVLSEPAQGASVGPFEAELGSLAERIAARF